MRAVDEGSMMWLRPLRVVAGVLAFALLVAACARTPPDGERLAGDGEAGRTGLATGGEAAAEVPAGDAGQAPESAEPADAVSGGGQQEQQGSADAESGQDGQGQQDASSGPQEGQTGSGGDEPSNDDTSAPGEQYQGVDGRTVKFVYSTQLEDCGDDPSTSGQGTANEKGLRVLEEWVGWFNGVLAEETDRGWQLEYEVVDDGGRFCPEKARATALQITKEIQPFAVLSNHIQPAEGPIIADAATRAGIVHVGPSWPVAEQIREREPYAWPVNAVGERQFENLTAWMARRIKGTEPPDEGTGGLTGERTYGVLAIDSPVGRQLGSVVQDQMRSEGMAPEELYLMSGDPGVAAQQASSTALKMREDGVNSLVLAVPYPSAINTTIVLSEAMNSQNYLPDVFVANYGLALFDSAHNKRVWSNAKGTATLIPLTLRWAVAPDENGNIDTIEEFEEIPENESGYIKVWQDRLGHNDQPQNDSQPTGYMTWTQLSLLVTGLLHLDEDEPLTPQTFGEAVHSARRGGPNRCTIGRFLVRDYDWTPGFDWELGNSGLRAKSTSVYWVNEQTPMGSNGYYESYDHYRYYGADEWPAEHTHDTGQEGVDIPKQERIGIRPWTPCSQFPNYPDG